MLRKNQPALQVKEGDNWKYVFCHNNGAIITTETRHKALNAEYDLQYFANKFGNHQFQGER